MQSIGVIGAGAWGTALAAAARAQGCAVTLWAREPEVVAAINERHENTSFLPGIPLDSQIKATNDLATACASDALLLVTPAQAVRAVAKQMKPHLSARKPVLICAKGIEIGTGKLLSQILDEELPEVQVGVLSGPTFAAEVARNLPAAVTLACADKEIGQTLMQAIGGPTFRPYYNEDVIGVQIGGAVKNVLAIACGIVNGKKLGDNARAALTTRGLAEMTRLGMALGANPESLMGLSGLGDLVLTCGSLQSRNMSFGTMLGEGQTAEQILGSRKAVTEGVYTAKAVVELADTLGIDMPICRAVHAVINDGADLDDTIKALLNRPFRAESERLGS